MGSFLRRKCKAYLERSVELCQALCHVYAGKGIPVTLLTYVPEASGSGVDPTRELYDKFEEHEDAHGVPDIVIAPCGYSLTHTNWRKTQNKKGSRIATMSNASLAMFVPGGPFDVQGDYEEVVRETHDIANKLRGSKYVRINGPGTNLIVNIDPTLVHAWTGRITEPGTYENWLGAEAFVVPVHLGESHGYFTTPRGWGGREQLEHDTKFTIRCGRFSQIEAVDGSSSAQTWIDRNLAPMIFEKSGHDILAELGFGSNFAVTEEYIMRNWSIAIAEKLARTKKGRRPVHVAHGNSKGMGGINDVSIHQDFVIPEIEQIEFDYHP